MSTQHCEWAEGPIIGRVKLDGEVDVEGVLQEVRDLHHQHQGHGNCCQCGWDWPCPTAQAISRWDRSYV